MDTRICWEDVGWVRAELGGGCCLTSFVEEHLCGVCESKVFWWAGGHLFKLLVCPRLLSHPCI